MIPGLKPYPAMKDSGVDTLGAVPAHWAALPEEPDDPDAAEGDYPGAAGRDDARSDLDRRTVVPATQEAMTS